MGYLAMPPYLGHAGLCWGGTDGQETRLTGRSPPFPIRDSRSDLDSGTSEYAPTACRIPAPGREC